MEASRDKSENPASAVVYEDRSIDLSQDAMHRKIGAHLPWMVMKVVSMLQNSGVTITPCRMKNRESGGVKILGRHVFGTGDLAYRDSP